MLEKISHLSIEESLSILQEYLSEHDEEVHIATKDYELNRKLVEAAPLHLQASKKNYLRIWEIKVVTLTSIAKLTLPILETHFQTRIFTIGIYR